MKIIRFSSCLCVATVVASLFGLTSSAKAAAQQAGAAPSLGTTAKASKAADPAANAAVEIPKSEFSIPASVAEGRDPFYPDRAIGGQELSRTPKATPVASFVLRGISGRFALINGRTFEVGEEADMTLGAGRVHVRCLAIREDSVTIEVEGKPPELKLRTSI